MEQGAFHGRLRRFSLPVWGKIVLAVLLSLVLFTGAWCLLLGPSGIAMVQTYLLARFAFVEEDADLDGATNKALTAFVDGLGDRWSYYLDPTGLEQTNQRRANNYVGIGVTVLRGAREEGLLVQSVSKDGPADKAGIVEGDVITAVDGVSIAGDAQESATERIQGEAGTQVTITLLREDGTALDVICTRATLHNPTASHQMLEGDIGYVRLENFYTGSAESFEQHVNELVEAGAKGLVIDLRSNPGGYVTELEEVLDFLLPEGPVFTMKPRWGFDSITQSDEDCIDLPMAVLVNSGTYSAAELLAAQLRESVSAPIVGQLTSGKGYSQITFFLANRGGVGLSTAAYCTGEGHSLIGEGITPDVDLSMDTSIALGSPEDTQLAAAAGLLRS